mmetsp:Transcript_8970/g.13484  ORF Transcript_8970/g.13484 Transcript_8970/m.13484 type:complete len:204 (-) Transcript_8970:827-1438(-)
MQYKASLELAGTDLIIYDGLIYRTLEASPLSSKYCAILSFMNSPIGGSFLFPPASFSALSPSSSSPAPSATTTTACPFSRTRRSRKGRYPPSPSSTIGISGTRHKSMSPLPKHACTAINPAERPMSLTTPTPLGILQRASVLADRIAACAASTAVWNPNERSMRSTSLSMVLGMPAMEMLSFLSMHSWASAIAPLCVPSPPIT